MADGHSSDSGATHSLTESATLRRGEGYFHAIARARYLVRRLFRIFDEHARMHGLESLQHQALIQVAGRDDGDGVSVGSLAHWLDIPSALASRHVSRLNDMGLVHRRTLESDRRVTAVSLSPQGEEVLAEISRAVAVDLQQLRGSLSLDDRRAALQVFLSYVGVPPSRETERGVEAMARGADEAAAKWRQAAARDELGIDS